MTLMTLNLGYGIGISPKQRHKRHQRHYRHTRAARGSGVHPRNAFVDIQTLCQQNMFPPKAGAIKSDTHINSYKFQSESVQIHPKILTRKSESVLIHSVKLSYQSIGVIRVRLGLSCTVFESSMAQCQCKNDCNNSLCVPLSQYPIQFICVPYDARKKLWLTDANQYCYF